MRDVERRERDVRIPTRWPTWTLIAATVVLVAAVFWVKGTYLSKHGVSAPVTTQDGTDVGKPMGNPAAPAPQTP